MYITFFAGSPCAKTVSFARNLPTFLPRPVESRNNFTSNAGVFDFAFFGRRATATLRDTLRTDEEATQQNCMRQDSKTVQYCTVFGRSARHHLSPNYRACTKLAEFTSVVLSVSHLLFRPRDKGCLLPSRRFMAELGGLPLCPYV